MKKNVFIGLGTNLGNKHQNLHRAIYHIQAMPHTKLLAVSTFYLTKPWGNTQQEDFLNACVHIQTTLDASTCMRYLLAIEENMGRTRTEDKWQPRIIDLDVLDFNREIIHTETIITPHPYLQERLFALLPLQELFPDYIHPVYQENIQEMINKLKNE